MTAIHSGFMSRSLALLIAAWVLWAVSATPVLAESTMIKVGASMNMDAHLMTPDATGTNAGP